MTNILNITHSNVQTQFDFTTLSAVTGSGKTRAATDWSIKRGFKTAVFMPILELIDTEVDALIQRYQGKASRVMVINSDDVGRASVADRITSFLMETKPDTGALLFITHEAFMRIRYWHNAKDWFLVVDEPLEMIYYEKFQYHHYRENLLQLVLIEKSCNGNYSVIKSRLVDEALVDFLKNEHGDEQAARFQKLASHIQDRRWTLHVDTEQFDRFNRGEQTTFEVHGYLSPAMFAGFKGVTLMSANLEMSLMYRVLQHHDQCSFVPHKGMMAGLQYQEHRNGKRLKVFYLTKKDWSKNLRDRTIWFDGKEQTLLTILKACILDKVGCNKYLWIGNNDIKDKEFRNGTRLNNKPYGLNTYQDYNYCAVVSALNAQSNHAKWLKEVLGISDKQRRTAMLSQVAYQGLGRGSMRRQNSTDEFVMIVPDLFTANDILVMYKDASAECLFDHEIVPDRGRGGMPSKGKTKSEKNKEQYLQKKAKMAGFRHKMRIRDSVEWAYSIRAND